MKQISHFIQIVKEMLTITSNDASVGSNWNSRFDFIYWTVGQTTNFIIIAGVLLFIYFIRKILNSTSIRNGNNI